MDWQPIETAPRDGRYVLLWGDDIGCVVGSWCDECEVWEAHGGMLAGSVADVCGPTICADVTHWAELPPPPSKEK